MNITIRPETVNDHRIVEELTRNAFWDLYVPRCNEHYLVYRMRTHVDFIPELNVVAEFEGRVVGSIMYTRSSLIGADQQRLQTVTFGPVSVLPEFQRKGIGSALIRHTTAIVRSQGTPAIIIYGNPSNYAGLGFVSSSKYRIGTPDGKYPSSMLVLPLRPELLANNTWRFMESDVFSFSADDAERFDRQFPPMEKSYRTSQEVFTILSRSFIQEDHHETDV